MFEEPFRWMEAISTRHSYVQEKLKKGRPVIAVPFNEGALLIGFSPQPGKIFEIHDRIALGGLGHPADVERLRISLIDMAHLEGFHRSAQDVTIARMLQFGIAPALKQNFEEIQRAPYLVQLLLVELGGDGAARFYRLNYDGHWETFRKGAVIAGSRKVIDWAERKFQDTDFASLPLDQALAAACGLWEESQKQSAEGETEGEPPVHLKTAFSEWVFEAAVLSRDIPRRCVYRKLGDTEIEKLRIALGA